MYLPFGWSLPRGPWGKTVLQNRVFDDQKGRFSPRGPTTVVGPRGPGSASAGETSMFKKRALFSDTGSKCYHFLDPDPGMRMDITGLLGEPPGDVRIPARTRAFRVLRDILGAYVGATASASGHWGWPDVVHAAAVRASGSKTFIHTRHSTSTPPVAP